MPLLNQVGETELLPGGSLTTVALGSARSMVTHKGSVLAQMYFTIAFLSLGHDLPAQAKPMALGAAPASSSSAAETGLGKNTHHCRTVGQTELPDTSGDASLSSSFLLHFSLTSL